MTRIKKMTADTKTFCKKHCTVVLCAFILLLAAVLYLYVNHFSTGGEMKMVTVISDGSLYGVYSLHEEQQIRIVSEYGYNLLVIKDNTAYVSEADCGNQVCVHTKAISAGGRQIVCLPHKLVISIESPDEENIQPEGKRHN